MCCNHGVAACSVGYLPTLKNIPQGVVKHYNVVLSLSPFPLSLSLALPLESFVVHVQVLLETLRGPIEQPECCTCTLFVCNTASKASILVLGSPQLSIFLDTYKGTSGNEERGLVRIVLENVLS